MNLRHQLRSRIQGIWKHTTCATKVFPLLSRNSTTNWVKIFTGLLFPSYVGIHKVRIFDNYQTCQVSLKQHPKIISLLLFFSFISLVGALYKYFYYCYQTHDILSTLIWLPIFFQFNSRKYHQNIITIGQSLYSLTFPKG